MSPNYKLTYFNVRGRGEVLRLAFAAVGVKFEDRRIEFSDWPEEKKNTPQGTLPYLVIDGKTQLPQSLSILRYIAREHGLYGKGKFDNARVDVFLDTILDLAETAYKAFFEKDQDKKKEMTEKFTTETCPKLLDIMERSAEGRGGFLVGGNMTAADIHLYSVLENIDMLDKLDQFPKLRAACRRVADNRGVKAYISTRPDTAF